MGANDIDPLMLGVLAQNLEILSGSTMVTLSLALSLVAIIANVSLMVGDVPSWRHEDQLHTMCMVCAFGAAFVQFLTAVTTRSAISGVIHAVEAVSLGTVGVTRGIMVEVFVWISAVIWFVAFLGCAYILRWEIRERKSGEVSAAPE